MNLWRAPGGWPLKYKHAGHPILQSTALSIFFRAAVAAGAYEPSASTGVHALRTPASPCCSFFLSSPHNRRRPATDDSLASASRSGLRPRARAWRLRPKPAAHLCPDFHVLAARYTHPINLAPSRPSVSPWFEVTERRFCGGSQRSCSWSPGSGSWRSAGGCLACATLTGCEGRRQTRAAGRLREMEPETPLVGPQRPSDAIGACDHSCVCACMHVVHCVNSSWMLVAASGALVARTV